MTENTVATVKVCRTEEMNTEYYGTLASTSYMYMYKMSHKVVRLPGLVN